MVTYSLVPISSQKGVLFSETPGILPKLLYDVWREAFVILSQSSGNRGTIFLGHPVYDSGAEK